MKMLISFCEDKVSTVMTAK